MSSPRIASEPSAQFARTVEANLAFWEAQAESLQDHPWDLAGERANLYRAIDFGLVLPRSRPQAAALAVRYARLMENGGFWHEWRPLLERITGDETDYGAETLGAALNWQGYFYLLDRRFDEALDAHRRQERLGRESGRPLEIAMAHYGLCHAYWRLRDYEQAKHFGEQALAGYLACGAEATKLAEAHNMLGLVAQLGGEAEGSAGHLRQAIHILRQLDEPIRLARTLKNLALTLESMGEPESALTAYQEAAGLLADAENELEKSMVELSLGTLYFNQDMINEAEAAFLRANSAYLRRSGPRYYQALAANNLANVYLRRGELERAEAYLLEAIDKWQQANANVYLAMSLLGLAEVRQNQDDTEAAEPLLRQALSIVEEYPQDAFACQLQEELERQLGELNVKQGSVETTGRPDG